MGRPTDAILLCTCFRKEVVRIGGNMPGPDQGDSPRDDGGSRSGAENDQKEKLKPRGGDGSQTEIPE